MKSFILVEREEFKTVDDFQNLVAKKDDKFGLLLISSETRSAIDLSTHIGDKDQHFAPVLLDF